MWRHAGDARSSSRIRCGPGRMSLIEATRRMLVSQVLPPPVNDARCQRCSLAESCLPDVVADRVRLAQVDKQAFEPAVEEASAP